MTEIDDEISGGLPIKSEDYAFFIRALWKSHQTTQKQLDQILMSIEEMKTDTKDLKDDVKSIRDIFTVSGKLASLIKWTAYVLVPIIGLGFGVYSFFYKGPSH